MGTEQENKYLTAAKGYLLAGYNVIPITPGEKSPLIGWKRYQTERSKVEELESWWDREPDANIGIVTGSISNLVVVDIDPRNGGDCVIHGKPLGVATVSTGGGGYHYYLSYSDKIGACRPGFTKGIDIKADGGYVLAPPSITSGTYRLAFGEPFPPVRKENDWLLTELKGNENNGHGVAVSNPGPSLVGNARLHSFNKPRLEQVPEGGRNNAAARLAGKMLYQGVSPTRMAQVVKLWNSGLTSPLSDVEINNVIKSITDTHKRKKGKA